MTEFVMVLTTFPADRDVDGLASRLVEDRLAACVNILPAMRSIYRWDESVEEADERQLIIKTTLDRVAALERLITELHPYDVPEFLVVPIKAGSEHYLKWLSQSTRP